MANKYIDSSLLDKAIVFAVKAHADTERRGKGFPYIVHPMEAVEIVATITPDQELLAAAALHDVVEDTSYTVDDIRAEFGDRIAALVEAESDKFDTSVSEADSWHDRKKAAINRLAAAPRDAKIVAMGDKLSNMRAIWRDYVAQGDELWKIFHVKDKASHEWHYRGLAASLFELSGTHAYQEFVSLIDKVFGTEKVWKAHLIDLADYEESGAGYTATSYNHKDGKTMIKLYSDFIPQYIPQRELKVAFTLIQDGLKTPAPGRLVTDGKRIGAEFERITPKKSFSRAIADNPQDYEKYALKFADMVRKLHSTPADKSVFDSAENFYKGVLKDVTCFTEEQKKKIFNFIDNVPKADTCVHGDLHIGNVITRDDECWWIDLGDFCYGNPLYDLGTLYFVSHVSPDPIIEDIFHISKELFQKVWDVFIRRYYGTDDDEAIAEYEKQIRPFAALKAAHFGSRDKMFPELQAIVDECLFN